jgi:hypothetical protein
MVFWNARGLPGKHALLKDMLVGIGATYCGCSESWTYKDECIEDADWEWEAGVESLPTPSQAHPVGGLGALLRRGQCSASLVASGKYTMWHRVEMSHGARPLFVGLAYFPNCRDLDGHAKANRELRQMATKYMARGHVVVGGDFNAHTGSNGDSNVDEAGRMLNRSFHALGLKMVNELCKDNFTRVEVTKTRVERTTVDYVACSPSLARNFVSLRFNDDQLGSDHKPLVLTLSGLNCTAPATPKARLVWRVENIVSPPESSDWVDACSVAFNRWVADTGSLLASLEAVDVENDRIADILDWSFQRELDTVANSVLGCRKVGSGKPTHLHASIRLLNDNRVFCERLLKRCMNDTGATDNAKRCARSTFLKARRLLASACAKQKDIAELRLFRDIETNQGNSRLFWSKVKRLRAGAQSNKSPPPIVDNADGDTETDPTDVLRVWRQFCTSLAAADQTGTEEEGIYDEDHKAEVENHLALLRRTRLTQAALDHPITVDEVFAAIRALKVGSAPGEDGVLPSILKSAANAVNTSTLEDNNSVVAALALMFNFILDKEVWPRRWRSGIIFPLFKDDSRLQPSNYRPITLLSVAAKVFGRIINTRLSTWCESAGVISDEQGGFRAKRGTPDQIFLLQEILAFRKERGFATYATFVDVRKAYDTVWREGAYARLHKIGIRGKLWRQLQAMNEKMERKIRLPIGNTDSFPVGRGVSQGAVESPWFYSVFIDALADELKRRGFGPLIAGRRVPLLMYADDIVLLAQSPQEMRRMHNVISSFAMRNRFQINGKKSAIMLFNVPNSTRNAVRKRKWSIFNENVLVVDKYKYLGVTVLNASGDFRHHVGRRINTAKAKAAELAWLCKRSHGLCSRSAVTLFKAIVRPILEYGAELFAGSINQSLTQKAEQVQSTFAKVVLGLPAHSSNDFALAEVGLERIQARWAKLRIGYWRRIFAADKARLLYVVGTARWREQQIGGPGAHTGWMRGTQHMFHTYNISHWWAVPTGCRAISTGNWQSIAHKAVNIREEGERATRLSHLPSLGMYNNHIKDWANVSAVHAVFSGEIGRNGALVPEPYLDDRSAHGATLVKLLCRGNCLGLLDKIGRERGWGKLSRVCPMCDLAAIESVPHFILHCPHYAKARCRMLCAIKRLLSQGREGTSFKRNNVRYTSNAPRWDSFAALADPEKLGIMLGQKLNDPVVEQRIDIVVKRFLGKAWKVRERVACNISKVLNLWDNY